MARPGTIQKGEVRNPRGARKKDKTISELAAKESPEAFNEIVKLSKAGATPDPRIRLDALKYIIDRDVGRPSQAVNVTGELNHTVTVKVSLKAVPE